MDNALVLSRVIININMQINKGDQILDFITGNSQQSDIDLFSKLQANFLQKFFKYNLSDYFSQMFSNLYEDTFDRKINVKGEKLLAASLFVANKDFSVNEFEKKLENFYKSRSKSFLEKHLQVAFKKLYCNYEQPWVIKEGQLVLVDVKIKAEVQKIQEVPQKILKCLSNFKSGKKNNLSQLEQVFSTYKQQYLNLFFVYFGDINFNKMNKKMYETEQIKIMGKTLKFRIFVFFISKQSLIETFKIVNKIDNLQIINDLVIQFYELKRAKQRQKRTKTIRKDQKQVQVQKEKQKINITHLAFGVVGVISLTIFGLTIKKMFF